MTVTVALTGQEVTADYGTITAAPEMQPLLDSQVMTADVGDITVAVEYNETVSLTGQEVTADQGGIWVAPNDVLVFPTGQEVTASIADALMPTDITIELFPLKVTKYINSDNPDTLGYDSNAAMAEAGHDWLVVSGETEATVTPDPNTWIVVEADSGANTKILVPEDSANTTFAVAAVDDWVAPEDDDLVTNAIDTILSDTFTNTNGTAISSHSPDVDLVGGGWSNPLWEEPEIQGNRWVSLLTANQYFSLIDLGQDTDFVWKIDQEQRSSVNNSATFYVSYADANNYIAVIIINNNNWRIDQYVAGIRTIFSTYFSPPTPMTANIYIVRSGTGIDVYVDDKITPIMSATGLTSTTGNTNIGMRYYGSGSDRAQVNQIDVWDTNDINSYVVT